MTIRYEQERAAAREAARLAGQLCLAVRQQMLSNNSSTRMEKTGREPVTIADYGSQALILRYIAAHFPQDAWLAEERLAEFDSLTTPAQREQIAQNAGEILGATVSPSDIRHWLAHAQMPSSKRIWTIDPIDGTKGFLRGDQFAIAIALLVEGQPTVAALACPLLPFEGDTNGVITIAVRGAGATIESLHGGAPRPLRVSTQSRAAQARVVESVEASHTDHKLTADIIKLAGIEGKPLRIDSQAKYVAVADGRAEVYIRGVKGTTYHEKVWDHAAGALIVEEAGGQVTDLDGNPLDFSHGERLTRNRGVLVTNGLLHSQLLQAIHAT